MAQIQIAASSDLFFSNKNLSSDKLHKVIVYLDQKFHRHNKKCVLKMHEVGGNCKIDLKNKKILKGQTSNGKYSEIHMSRGIVEWHSHPSQCKNKEYCTVDTPSDTDFINILLGSLHGGQVHLVYSGYGIWVVRVQLKVIDYLKKYPEKLVPLIKSINYKFNKLHDNFDAPNSKMTIVTYRRRWINLARRFGFTIEKFSNNTRTIGFELIVSDTMLKHANPKIYSVHVPDSTIRKVDSSLPKSKTEN